MSEVALAAVSLEELTHPICASLDHPIFGEAEKRVVRFLINTLLFYLKQLSYHSPQSSVILGILKSEKYFFSPYPL